MPRARKVLRPGELIEFCTRLKEGLPLTAIPFVQKMLEGVLAKAQQLYPVTIGNFIVMPNHIHMHLVVHDINDLASFKQHFKTNSSKLINKLLGTTGSIWEEGSDAPVVLDLEKLEERLVYFFLNPQKAGLVDTIQEYPNLCTWSQFCEGVDEVIIETELPSISKVPRVEPGRLNKQLAEQYDQSMKEATWETNPLVISPMACFDALGCSVEQRETTIRNVCERVIKRQEELKWERLRTGKKAVGRIELIYASLHRKWTPTKKGRRMICLCSCINKRIDYLLEYKEICRLCREIYREWCDGNFTPMHPWVYSPRGPTLCQTTS